LFDKNFEIIITGRKTAENIKNPVRRVKEGLHGTTVF
jgi:hypothetical protein